MKCPDHDFWGARSPESKTLCNEVSNACTSWQAGEQIVGSFNISLFTVTFYFLVLFCFYTFLVVGSVR